MEGIALVFMQEIRLISYLSKGIKGKQLTLSTYKKKLYTIVMALQKWRPYLLGQPFNIQIDQQSFKYLLEQKIGTHIQHKQMSKLIGYDFIMGYKSSNENLVVDVLS